MTPESGQALGGVPQEVLDTVIVAPVDAAAVDRILTEDNDIAAVIVESNGALRHVPADEPDIPAGHQGITTKHGVVFIMDEVITGFRLSPGGAQVRWDPGARPHNDGGRSSPEVSRAQRLAVAPTSWN